MTFVGDRTLQQAYGDRGPESVLWKQACAKAAQMFPNQGLRETATAVIFSHKYAEQYLRQAPVLLIALCAGRNPKRAQGYSLLGQQFARLIEGGPPLKEVMRKMAVAYPLRAIKSTALSPTSHEFVHRISMRHIHPSVLAQAIPPTVERQRLWMRWMMIWLSEGFAFDESDDKISWAARVFGHRAKTIEMPHRSVMEVTNLKHFAFSNDVQQGRVVFDKKWTFEQAENAANRWIDAANRRNAENTAKYQYGIGAETDFTTQANQAPLPRQTTIGPYLFTSLNSVTDVLQEGIAMRHCLGTHGYIPRMLEGKYRAYSVTMAGQRVATIGVMERVRFSQAPVVASGSSTYSPIYVDSWQIDQIQGPRLDRSRRPEPISKELHDATRQFLNRLKKETNR